MKFKMAQRLIGTLCAMSVFFYTLSPHFLALQKESSAASNSISSEETAETPSEIPEEQKDQQEENKEQEEENKESNQATPSDSENSSDNQADASDSDSKDSDSSDDSKQETVSPSETTDEKLDVDTSSQATSTESQEEQPKAETASEQEKQENLERANQEKIWHVLHNTKGYMGHNYSGNGPATALYQDMQAKEDQKLSLQLKPLEGNTNFGVFYYYLDDNNWLYVGNDTTSGWYYQYRVSGQESYPKISGLPTPKNGETLDISISLGRETLIVNVNGVEKKVTNQALIDLSEKINQNTSSKFGVMTKGSSKLEFTNVKVGSEALSGTWDLLNQANGTLTTRTSAVYSVSGTVVDNNKKPLADAVVRAGKQSVKTDENGSYTLNGLETGTYSLSVSKPGYQAATQNIEIKDGPLSNIEITLSLKQDLDLSSYDTLENDKMRVYIGKDFPVVARYEVLSGAEKPLVFEGQHEKISTVLINGISITPTVTTSSITNGSTSKTYELTVKDTDSKIDAVITVEISIEQKNLTWKITDIKKSAGSASIDTIEIPNLNLLTVTDLDFEKASEAQKPYVGFAGAKASTVTTVSGDQYIGFDEQGGFVPMESDKYLYGFVSNGYLSAGLFSNSEMEGDKRVQRNNGSDFIALTSSPFYYEHGDKAVQAYAQQNTDLKYPKSQLPVIKVALAQDENKDGQIDWNDGAIAFRDIMNIPMGAESIKDLVNYRIVMNFASMATNPYLETADQIKKVFLATDGLPQAVMLKGYGNEGHDSANSEYADIATREGGVKDFQSLIEIAHQYATEIGIHINAQEAYPESKSFSNRMVNYPNIRNGWGWLDQSHVIDKIWDLASDNRLKRLVQLYDRINGTNFLTAKWPAVASSGEITAPLSEIAKDAAKRKNNMDFIYLDVWYQDAWETRRIAEQINNLGWRFSTEFSDRGEYDSTWQHWSTDAVYGGAGMKGFNSDIIRFIRNHLRDSQVLNYPEFGGAADNPLLGGFRLAGFEGWGGDQDFNYYIYKTFSENLPTRFLQHYEVMKWENYTGTEQDRSPVGNHEKQITLGNEKGDIVIVKRNEKQREDSIIERTITLNGTEVLVDGTYLLPWQDYQGEADKLYHWNEDGGKTTWKLPASFANESTLTLYELTDQGRINPTAVSVQNGSITIQAKAKTPYILVASPGVKTLAKGYGEKDFVADPGFNGYADGDSLKANDWSGDINSDAVQVKKAVTGDQNLVFSDTASDISVSTKINGLTKGESYVAEIYVDNKSDQKATLSIDNGKETVSNYTERSIAGNYVKTDEGHLSKGYDSKMQWIQVPFVAQSSTATLTLSRQAGKGAVIWDDIRIVPITLNNEREDGSFFQDFEHVVQGLYPFVLGPAQGVSDPVTHLSQLHAPYTQSGWHTKILDDVIGGEWSLKHHGSNVGIIYQTIPQNFRFEPGKVYEVTFDYQVGANDAYAMVIGDGENFTMPQSTDYFKSTAAPAVGQKSTTKQHQMTVTGSASGQTWIGLYGNGRAGNDGMGGMDFILDNLHIREIDASKIGISLSVTSTHLFQGETALLTGTDLQDAVITSSNPNIVAFDETNNMILAKSAGIATITAQRKGKVSNTASVTITVSDRDSYPLSTENATIIKEGNSQPGVGASNILDGNTGTNWDGAWDKVTKENPASVLIDFGKVLDLSGFRFLQRTSYNKNGMIQGYRYRVSTELNNANEIQGIEFSEWKTVENQKENTWVDVPLSDNKTTPVRYLELEVYGTNNNATIAELVPYFNKLVATEATVTPIDVYVGQTKALEALPVGDTLLKGLVWSTNDTSLIQLSKDGIIKGLAPGKATVTVTNAAGLKASGTVTVISSNKPLPDTTALAQEILAAQQVDLEKYQDGNEKQTFITALEKAKYMQNHPEQFTQSEIDAMVQTLSSARKALKEKPGVVVPPQEQKPSDKPTPTPTPSTTPTPSATPTATPVKTTAPQMGDTFPVSVFVILMVISIVGFGVSFWIYRNKKSMK